jgi:tetratricopeptide (TPR) repeat protein
LVTKSHNFFSYNFKAELFKEDPTLTEEATREYKEALRIVKKNLGKGNIEVAKVRERYAGNAKKQFIGFLIFSQDFLIKYDFLALAENQLKSALAIKETESTSIDCCDIYDNLGSLSLRKSQPAEAKNFFEKSLKERQSKFGVTSIKIVPTLNNLSVANFALQENEVAKIHLENALEIFRKSQVNGEVSSLYGNILDNLAKYHYKMGSYQECVNLFQESISVKEKCVGTRHTHFAIGVGQLGVAMTTLGDAREAQKLLQDALRLFKELLGDAHTLTAIAMNNIGYHACVTGNWDEAQKMFAEASNRLSGQPNLSNAASTNLDFAQSRDAKAIIPLFFDNFSLPAQDGNALPKYLFLHIFYRKY